MKKIWKLLKTDIGDSTTWIVFICFLTFLTTLFGLRGTYNSADTSKCTALCNTRFGAEQGALYAKGFGDENLCICRKKVVVIEGPNTLIQKEWYVGELK